MKLDKEIKLTKVNNSASRFSLKSNNTMKRSKVKRNGVRLTEFKLIKKDVLISQVDTLSFQTTKGVEDQKSKPILQFEDQNRKITH